MPGAARGARRKLVQALRSRSSAGAAACIVRGPLLARRLSAVAATRRLARQPQPGWRARRAQPPWRPRRPRRANKRGTAAPAAVASRTRHWWPWPRRDAGWSITTAEADGRLQCLGGVTEEAWQRHCERRSKSYVTECRGSNGAMGLIAAGEEPGHADVVRGRILTVMRGAGASRPRRMHRAEASGLCWRRANGRHVQGTGSAAVGSRPILPTGAVATRATSLAPTGHRRDPRGLAGRGHS